MTIFERLGLAKPRDVPKLPDFQDNVRDSGTVFTFGKGSKVPVLVWKISDRDEQNLDRYEGYPSYYIKQDVEFLMTDLRGRNPRPVTAMVYIMADGHRVRMPMKGYVDILVEGYERFGFDMDILREALRETRRTHELTGHQIYYKSVTKRIFHLRCRRRT